MSATPVRQVRVFVSSTFRDMNSERDHLVTVVFPELRDRVEQLGFEFFDVDLRWGVPQAGVDGERANSWAYCKRWIDEVEPFFVCMLGQRYGWRPPAGEIAEPVDRERYMGMSITEMEISHALFHAPHDKHSLFYLRETEVPTDVPNYAEFVDVDDLDDLARLKTLIGKSRRPVRPYAPEWTGDGFTNLDEFGAMVLEDLWRAILRDERYVPRSAWEEVLGSDWEQNPLYADPSAAIPEEIWTKLVDAAKPPPRDPLDVEADQMARFANSRLRWFQGRTHELAELRAFVEGDQPEDASRLCVVRAAAGTGKTALLARLAEGLGDSDCLLLMHLVGASEQSASAWSLVKRLLDELDRQQIPDPEPKERPELDLNGLSRQLARRLAGYDREPRLVIILDALNQLTDGHSLFWLPQQVGPNVRIVVSCLDAPQSKPDSPPARVLQALQHRRPEPRWVKLAPLEEADVREIVPEYLHEYCKELDREQVDMLAAMPQARNPLYLRVMLDVLRALGGNDMHLQVSDLIARIPAERPDATSLFTWLLERLDQGFGEEEVALWCSYLALGRVGMSGEELAALLARKQGDGDPAREEAARRTARRIERALRRYLQRRGPQWDFFHGSLREAVEQHCLCELDPVALQADIAGHFETRWRDGDVHALSELPYHCTEGRCWDDLEATLTDLEFLEAKAEGAMVFHLAMDFTLCNGQFPQDRTGVSNLRLLEQALRNDLHFIARHPTTLFQCLWNSAWWYDSLEAAKHYDPREDGRNTVGLPWERPEPKLCTLLERWRDEKETRQPGFFWVRSLRPPPFSLGGPQVLCLRGHEAGVTSVAFSRDGRAIASASNDRTVRLWDALSGTELLCIEGHEGWVTDVEFSPDGGEVASGSWDYTVRWWDCGTGRELRRVQQTRDDPVSALAVASRHGKLFWVPYDSLVRVWDLWQDGQLTPVLPQDTRINAVGLSRDQELIASAAEDGTVHVWSLADGHELTCHQAHAGSATSVDISPDGLCTVSGGEDRVVKVSSLTDEGRQVRLCGHSDLVSGVCYSPTGAGVASCSWDRTVRLWDPVAGTESACLFGHTSAVLAVSFSPDGEYVASGSDDQTVRVWRLSAYPAAYGLLSNESSLTSIAFSPRGDLLATGHRDGSIRIWCVASGRVVSSAHPHRSAVNAVAWEADGRRLVTGSEDATLCVLEAELGRELARVDAQGSPVTAVAVAGGVGILFGLRNGRVLRFTTGNAEASACLGGHTSAITALAVSSGGLAATSSQDGTVRVWSVCSGNEVACLLEPTTRACREWDANVRRMLDVIRTERPHVMQLVFSPDGAKLAAAGLFGWAKKGWLWDIATGVCSEEVDALIDAEPLARGHKSMPWELSQGAAEVLVTSSRSARWLAGHPWGRGRIAACPDGRTWAGAEGNYLALFTLDGGAAENIPFSIEDPGL